jgi:seryl-tRNA synthetase
VVKLDLRARTARSDPSTYPEAVLCHASGSLREFVGGGKTMGTEDEYRAKTHEALDKLWAQIDELKKEANEASGEARERFDKAIDALKKRQAETKSKLDQATDATGDAWKKAAKQVEDAVDDLGETFSTLADEVDASVRSAGAAAKAGQQGFLAEWKKQREERKKLLDTA